MNERILRFGKVLSRRKLRRTRDLLTWPFLENKDVHRTTTVLKMAPRARPQRPHEVAHTEGRKWLVFFVVTWLILTLREKFTLL